LPTSANLMDNVADAMREAAHKAILPRFRKLAAGDINEKTPGEIVTAADREAERILHASLCALLPGSKFIGEELVSEKPDMMNAIGDETVWLVDPLDGTANFARGSADFAVMIALLKRGEIVASWMLDPVNDVLYTAELGSGAFRNGEGLRCSSEAPPLAGMRGPILWRFLPTPLKSHIETRSHRFGVLLQGTGSAGVDYPAVIEGRHNFILYWRTLAWDHAPGALFTREAGGYVARPDGSPYRVGDDRWGLLVAQNEEVWNQVQRALFEGYF
jgi:fructose-1,6-bisphosphatase/inositol monophosphatase family enzyme